MGTFTIGDAPVEQKTVEEERAISDEIEASMIAASKEADPTLRISMTLTGDPGVVQRVVTVTPKYGSHRRQKYYEVPITSSTGEKATVGMTPKVYELYREAKTEEMKAEIMSKLPTIPITTERISPDTGRITDRAVDPTTAYIGGRTFPTVRQEVFPTFHKMLPFRTKEEHEAESRASMKEVRESPFEFMFAPPKPTVYYEEKFGKAAPIVEFGSASLTAAVSVFDPKSWFSGEQIDLSGKSVSYEMAKGKEFAIAQPFTTLGYAAGFGMGMAAFGKGASRIAGGSILGKGPKPTYEVIKYGKSPLYRGIAFEYGSGQRAVGIAGFKGRKPVLGTPTIDISGVTFGKKGYVPISPFETSTLLKSLGKTRPKAKGMIDPFVRGSQITETQKSKFITELSRKGTKTLTPKGAKEVIKFAQRQDAMLYGSYTAEAQMPMGRLGRMAGDIDVSIPKAQAEIGPSLKGLVGKLTKTEGVGRVRVRDMLIETKDTRGLWHHAVDIHAKDMPLDVMTPGLEGGFGFKLDQKPITISGTKAMPLSEFGLRKGRSVSTIRDIGKDWEFGFGPEKHRIKDIGDYMTAQQTLIESRGRFGYFGTRRAKGYLAAYEKQAKDLFGIEPSKAVKIEMPMVSKAKPSPSLYKYPSMAAIPSISPMISPSISPGPSVAPSMKYPSYPSRRPSPKTYPSLFPSPSLKPSVRPSIMPSVYPSPKPSPRPKAEAYPGFKPYAYPDIYPGRAYRPLTPPSRIPPMPPFTDPFKPKRDRRPKKKEVYRKFRYTPSLGGVLGMVKPISKAPARLTGLKMRPLIMADPMEAPKKKKKVKR